MKSWVLVLLIASYESNFLNVRNPTVSTVEFPTAAGCEAAAAKVNKQLSMQMQISHTTICVEKK